MANKRVKPIRIGYNEVREVIPAGPPNGTVLVMNLICGNPECKFKFVGRYHMAQLSDGFPHETCPNCQTVNYVPYDLSGRSNA